MFLEHLKGRMSDTHYFYVGKNQTLCMVDEADREFVESSRFVISQGNIKHKPSDRLLHSIFCGTRGLSELVIHKDGDKLNCKRSNLDVVKAKGRKRGSNKSLRMINSAGRPCGVFKSYSTSSTGKRHYQWRGACLDEQKCSSISKYGEDKALKLAIKWRLKKLKESGREIIQDQADYDGWGNRTAAEFYG